LQQRPALARKISKFLLCNRYIQQRLSRRAQAPGPESRTQHNRHDGLTPVHRAVCTAPDLLVHLEAVALGRGQCPLVCSCQGARAPLACAHTAFWQVKQLAQRPSKLSDTQQGAVPLQERSTPASTCSGAAASWAPQRDAARQAAAAASAVSSTSIFW